MERTRPDPDELLTVIRDEDQQAERGRLKIFLGYAAGVGKTYAMLSAARERQTEGTDVLIGYVETHGRPETERLLEGMPTLERLSLIHISEPTRLGMISYAVFCL